MVIKLTMKNTILFLTTVLLIFHTVTYMQAYYSFAVTVGLFGLIMVLFFLGRKSLVVDKRIMTVLFLDVATVLVIVAGILIRNFDPIELVGRYLPYIMWPTLYTITEPLFDEKSRKRTVVLFVIAMAIGVIATLKVVSVDENAARLLAGAASDARRLRYYQQGVGGYGFVYGTVFILFCVLAWATLEKKPLLKTALLALSITSCVMIFFASYTTAVLLAALVVLLALFSRTSQKNAAIYLILIACVLALFFEDILIGIRDFAENLDMRWITKRINQLLEAETSGDMDGLRRVELYKISFETFTNNILLGGPDIGGHSMFLDTIANYGLIGVSFIVAFCMMLNEKRRNCTIMKGSIYYLCILFLCINTMDVIVLLPMMTFALPLFLKMVEDKQKFLQQ